MRQNPLCHHRPHTTTTTTSCGSRHLLLTCLQFALVNSAGKTLCKKAFISAEVIAYKDLVELGSFAAARAIGKLRTEGKEYVVEDGDVIEFKTFV